MIAYYYYQDCHAVCLTFKTLLKVSLLAIKSKNLILIYCKIYPKLKTYQNLSLLSYSNYL